MRNAAATLLLFSCPLLAQQESAGTPGDTQGTIVIVEGVVESPDGPVAGARMQFSRRIGPATVTDENGRYLLEGQLSGTGPVPTEVRCFPPEGYDCGPHKQITLHPGIHLREIDFRARRGAVISGRVLDADRRPLAGAVISLYQAVFWPTGRRYASAGAARTDATGEYRLETVEDGYYYMRAAPPPQNGSDRLRTVARFHGNSESITTAQRIWVGDGVRFESFDLVLPEVETFCVHGTALPPDDQAADSVQLRIMQNEPGWYGWYDARPMIRAVPGKPFEVCGLAPGDYTLFFLSVDDASPQGPFPFTRQEFSITDRDADIGSTRLPWPRTVSGRVVVQDTKRWVELPDGIRISLLPRDRPAYGDYPLSAGVTPDGTFSLDNVYSDTYDVGVSGFPDDFYVSSIRQGFVDVLDEGLSPGQDVEVRLAADGATITGTVVDESGAPVSNAVVILLPGRSEVIRRPPTVRSDHEGQFEFRSLAPGERRLLAFTGLRPGELADPYFLASQLNRAERIELRSEDRRQITIEVRELR